MSAAALAVLVQARLSTELLKQLTNDDSTATSIDTTRLEAACSDAIGDFERITGMTHDTTNTSHIPILVTGSLFFLESYKSREGALTTSHMKRFYSGCENFRKLAWVSPSTNSTLAPSTETEGALPDMDRSKAMWRPGGYVSTPQETLDL